MKNENNFYYVVSRLKKSLKIKSDSDIAKLLGISASTFSERKSRDSLPYEELIKLADSENIDLNWLLTGEGTMYRNEKPSPLDPEIAAVVSIMKELEPDQKTTVRASAEAAKQLTQMKRQLSELTTRLSA